MIHESPQTLKEKLLLLISEMQQHSELFVKQPGKDFSRNRKLSFSQTMQFLLSMNGNTLHKEWLDFWNYPSDCISLSAFFQQRQKILPEAMEFLFHSFNETFFDSKKYHGYRLLACDGSDLPITYNPKDENTYRRHNSVEKHQKGYNQLHLNALYDLQNRIYLDAIIQPGRHPNEMQALIDMMQRSKLGDPVLLIADRGYESYNLLAHAQEKGWKYLIRVKDIGSRGILTHLPLPEKAEFDCTLSLTLTKKQTNEIKAQPSKYRCLTNKSSCDFLDPVNNPFYTLYFRVLRFAITKNTYECIITNLEQKEFSSEEIKTLYGKRWGIERSFRELKYTIGLTNFHAKKVEYILQEIFARLIIYNFCERIITKVVIQQKTTKYIYQINFTVAVLICRQFFRGRIPPPTVEAIIQKNVLPVREGRKAPRKVRPNSAVSFLYRIA
jgi:hypothetical protein